MRLTIRWAELAPLQGVRCYWRAGNDGGYMKKWPIALTVVASVCFAALFARSWMSESTRGVYLMTFLWGGAFLLSLVSLVLRVRAKG